MALLDTSTTAPRRRLGVDAEHPHYKWWALSCTSLGMLLATINSGTLIIALPDLERSLGTSLLQLVWGRPRDLRSPSPSCPSPRGAT